MDVIDVQSLSVEPIPEDMQGVYGSEWKQQSDFPPVHPPGRVDALIVSAINQISEFPYTRKGDVKPVIVVKFDLNFSLPTGQTVVNFQELIDWRGNSSQVCDLFNACGYTVAPEHNQAIGDRVVEILEHGTQFPGQIDWIANCKSCQTAKLLDITGQTTTDEGWEALRSMDRGDDKKEFYAAIRGAYEKSRSSRFFPESNRKRIDKVNCPDCQAEIKAKTYIRRFLAP
jgi:hypothetical protein